jgi:hypothetical protein
MLKRVEIHWGAARPPTKVLATDETCVDIEVRIGNRAHLFEIKVEHVPVDAVKERAEPLRRLRLSRSYADNNLFLAVIVR